MITCSFSLMPTIKKKLLFSEIVRDFWHLNEAHLNGYFPKNDFDFFKFYIIDENLVDKENYFFNSYKYIYNEYLESFPEYDFPDDIPWPVEIDYIVGTEELRANHWIEHHISSKFVSKNCDIEEVPNLMQKVKAINTRVQIDFKKSRNLAAKVAMLFTYVIAKQLEAVIFVLEISPESSIKCDDTMLPEDFFKKFIGMINNDKVW